MKSQFIQDVEAFAKEMAVRLPKTHEGGIIIMATDNNDIAKCIIARPSHLCIRSLEQYAGGMISAM